MPEIDNMPGASAGSLQQISDFLPEFRKRSKQGERVQIALNGRAVIHLRPSGIDVDTPIHADDITPGLSNFAQESTGARSKVDYRNVESANAFDKRRRMRLNIPHVVPRAQRSHPTVEDLYGSRACAHLKSCEVAQNRTSFSIRRCQTGSLPNIRFLVFRKVLEDPPSIM